MNTSSHVHPHASTPPEPTEGKKIPKAALVNKLNLVNFQDKNLLISFKHTRYNNKLYIPAKPQPCLGDHLDCIWHNPEDINDLKDFRVEEFVLSSDGKVIRVKAECVDLNHKKIRFILPETSVAINSRKASRHVCKGITARLCQNGVMFQGTLEDFSPASFRVRLSPLPSQTFQWLNPNATVTIIISNEQEVLYTGECNIIKHGSGHHSRTIILEPVNQRIRRFKPKEFRSVRMGLTPSPSLYFRHPLIGKKTSLATIDVSGAGFSVEEDSDTSLLLPGLIFPEIEINFTGVVSLKCRAQIIYKNEIPSDKERGRVRCGIAILDMDLKDHMHLIALVHQAQDKKSYICSKVDIDALWEFFFKAGFVYPKKYAALQGSKDDFKETYNKLYSCNPSIARHFIYQDKGQILGHLAMLRIYENTWLIHHHAAAKSESTRAGLAVLQQVANSINDCHNLYSSHMHYVACYYRPENRFPNRIFGGIHSQIKDPGSCSINTFAYFQYKRTFDFTWDITGSWKLERCNQRDFLDLERFYEHDSGGLMIDAMDLEWGLEDIKSLSKEYERLGLKRNRKMFSLKKDDVIKAIFIINISDSGLNLSDLLNSIKVIIVDSEELSRETLHFALAMFSVKFDLQQMPVLLYPHTFAIKHNVTHEKLYNLWILDIPKAGAEYLKHIDTILQKYH